MWRIALALVVLAAPLARADGPRLLDDDTFAVRSQGTLAVDGALLVASPAALPAGMTTGVAAGITRECGCTLAYGARVAVTTETESSQIWTVTDRELRLRATGALRRRAGRGTFALRLSAGATIIHEDRVRIDSMLAGTALETRAIAARPAGELEAVIALQVAGPWLAVVSAGPELVVDGGGAHGGFVAQLGVAWQP